MSDKDDALQFRRALDKVTWAAAGVVAHPTSVCRPTQNHPCECGLWAALDLVRASRFGRLIRSDEYPL